jgi:predicted Zn-dependent protease
MKGRLLIAVVVAVFSLITYLMSSQRNPVTGQNQRIALSTQEERQIGAQQAPAMAQQFGGLDPDPKAQAIVREVGEGLQRQSEASKAPYRIEYYLLADRKTINAFALPGGPVFLTRGLLDKLHTRGELAGVLGHETGHVAARHSAQQLAKQRLTQGIAGAAAVGASNGQNDYTNSQIAAQVAGLLSLKYTRDDEKEADRLGVRFMSEAGYDPRALVGVMKVLDQASGPSNSPDFLQTHPAPANRIPLIQQEIKREFPQGIPANLAP